MVRPEIVLSLSPTVTVLPLGEDLTVFDATTGQTLALNRTAADLLALVDGRSSVEDLGIQLARRYAVSTVVAVAAARRVAQTLLDHHTVEVTAALAGSSEPS